MSATDDSSPDAALIRLFYEEPQVDPMWDDYPAHLHIDLLPAAQGQGWGRALMERFLAQVRSAGARGVHLGVARVNRGAVAFYTRLGFHLLRADEETQTLGLRLDDQ